MARQAHDENFFMADTGFAWLLFTKRFRKIRVERKWSTTFLVVSAENFREQRNITKKNQTRFETPA